MWSRETARCLSSWKKIDWWLWVLSLHMRCWSNDACCMKDESKCILEHIKCIQGFSWERELLNDLQNQECRLLERGRGSHNFCNSWLKRVKVCGGADGFADFALVIRFSRFLFRDTSVLISPWYCSLLSIKFRKQWA